ncbi:MAG: DNA polymerase III subunit delta', partial [Sulfurimonas sp.]
MQANSAIKGHIVISKELESEIERLEALLTGYRVVKFLEETFKIEHAKEVTAEAYISESATKYIILAAIDFTDVAQNSLLKLLEEPPRNIEFILLTPTKSTLLPTIRS